eukprot:7207399-Prymnesium_polylepis.1
MVASFEALEAAEKAARASRNPQDMLRYLETFFSWKNGVRRVAASGGHIATSMLEATEVPGLQHPAVDVVVGYRVPPGSGEGVH